MKASTILIAALVAGALAFQAGALDAFSIRTDSSAAVPLEDCTIPVAAGEILELSASDLELRLGAPEGSLRGLTVTALPQSSQGGLFLDGVEVEAYEFLSREEVDRLCFVPGDGSPGASITILPQGSEAVAASLSILVLDSPNKAPILEDTALETVENVSVSGYLEVQDPEGDPVNIKVLVPPEKGEVQFDGQSFVYEPYLGMTGSDLFVVCAVDGNYNYSGEATVEVFIEAASGGFTYGDMARNPSQYAAMKLWEKGVYTGAQIGTRYYFQPEEQMNRGDFLVLLLAAGGMEESITPTVNTNLPNDSEIPAWLKPYVKRGVEAGILDPDQPFHHREIPIRAEAVLMTGRTSGIDDVKDYPLAMEDAAEIPGWARSSYVDLAAYKMLDLHDGLAHPSGALTNSYAADLAWQLWKHKNR